ncbi:MAG: mechanosensitive ion channel family protein [Anaerolineae bacterium]|nr:mechanosensitive ion channel family protein [Anaerolineae bacterium]MDW8102190.1 mechanosensitive ion channel family protein [Anaerolineae bacterium]
MQPILLSVLENWVRFIMTRLPGAIAFFIGGWIALKVVLFIVNKAMQAAKTEPTIASLFRALLSVAGWILILAGTLRALGLNELALAISGSIAAVALGLATGISGTTSDILAGIFLATDPDFKVGYKVTAAGITGVIKSLDLRKTRIEGEDGKLYVIPNRAVESATWVVEERA